MIRLAAKSLFHFWRQSLCLVAGIALATAVLAGALIIGDSVRFTLRRAAALRLGRVEFAVGSGARAHADALARKVDGIELIPLLSLPGIVIAGEGGEAAPGTEFPGIAVYGVDPRFWQFAQTPPPPPGPRVFHLNQALARRLGAELPETLSVRVKPLAAVPAEAPLSEPDRDSTARLRGAVGRVLAPAELGNFGLAAEQISRPALFVDLAELQAATAMEGMANLFVGRTGDGQSVRDVAAALQRILGIADYGLAIRKFPEFNCAVVVSERVFLDEPVAVALRRLPGARCSLTYLVNDVARPADADIPATPYSFVEGVEDLGVPAPDAAPDAPFPAVVNSWLARELRLSVGDLFRSRYFKLEATGGLAESEAVFRVEGIAPVDEWAARRELGPRFPGLTHVESCKDWDVGMPMNQEKLADPANEAYWNAYGPTPKFRTTLAVARELWGNRYGQTTAVSLPLAGNVDSTVTDLLRREVAAEQAGLGVTDLAGNAGRAVEQAMDFGQLFLGMSFFIVAGAMLLVGLLVAFGMQCRLREIGLLAALGFPRRSIRRQFLLECGFLGLSGTTLGTLLATSYARLLLAGVNGRWQGAFADSAIFYRAAPLSLAAGWLAGFLLSLATAAVVLRTAGRRPPSRLLQGDDEIFSPRRRSRWPKWLAAGCLALALAIAGLAVALAPDALAGPFFAVGACLLAGIALGFSALLGRLAAWPGALRTPGGLIIGGLARRPGRTTVTFLLTAMGCLLLFAVVGMTRDPAEKARQRHSGTGGFELFADSAIPLMLERTAENPAGTLFPELPEASWVAMKKRDGDDASCRNLNAAAQPPLIGVDAARLARLDAFGKKGAETSVWSLLAEPGARAPGEPVPALAGDIDTAAWGLRMKTDPRHGGIIDYTNARGQTVRIRLVGRLPQRLTVFQGTILVSLRDFAEHFPENEGFRTFLFDVLDGTAETAARDLRNRYGRSGLDVQETTTRLAAFYEVEKTYLNIFLVLGGIGILLATVGLGIVTLRNILERQRELALLQAAGFTRMRIYAIILGESLVCLIPGIAAGLACAAAAIAPGILSGATRPPVAAMALVAAAIAANAMFWAALAPTWILRFPLLAALRNE